MFKGPVSISIAVNFFAKCLSPLRQAQKYAQAPYKHGGRNSTLTHECVIPVIQVVVCAHLHTCTVAYSELWASDKTPSCGDVITIAL